MAASNPPSQPPLPLRVARTARKRLRRQLGMAPRRPAGWTVGPPDFVGVGAQRAGTKWWYRLLCDHPQVQPGPGKEIHFFDGFSSRPLTPADSRAYHELFPRPPGSLTGEWTPRYMHDFWTPTLLRRAAPETRILVLLRDPWDRYLSGLAHEQRVLRRELSRGRGAYLRPTLANDALDRSLYRPQIVRLLDSFDRSRVLVLQYERCVQDPEGELQRTYRFLGLDHVEHLPATLRASTGRSSARVEMPEEVERTARRLISGDAWALTKVLPDLDLSLWPSCHEDRPAAPARRAGVQGVTHPPDRRGGRAAGSDESVMGPRGEGATS